MHLGEALEENERLKARVAGLEVQLEIERRLNAELRATIVRLEARIADLEMRTRQTSVTSHKPPSSDPTWEKEARRRERNKRKAGQRKRGAQRGHEGSRREVVKPDEVECYVPSRCEQCGEALKSPAEGLLRSQVTELIPATVKVIEHRSYRRTCSRCGHRTTAQVPDAVRAMGGFGPKLRTTMALLTGYYRISRRRCQKLLEDLFGLKISLGAVSENEKHLTDSLCAPHEDAHRFVQKSPAICADETTWCDQNQTKWLWTAVTPLVSVYKIQNRRNQDAAKALLGEFKGLLTSDRLGSYRIHPLRKRQICWAHLRRELKYIHKHVPEFRAWAKRFLRMLRKMFKTWNAIRDGTKPWSERRVLMHPFERETQLLAKEGLGSENKFVRNLCKGLGRFKKALFRFVLYGTEPTNNAAERALRSAVIWRKTSLGTQSERGCNFVERMLTAVESLRSQKRDVFEFLKTSLERFVQRKPLPLLPPAQ